MPPGSPPSWLRRTAAPEATRAVSLDEPRGLPEQSPARVAIEEETNRRDAPSYQALSEAEWWELIALLGALPG